MKYLRQFGIILLITFLGEVLNRFIPLPIPASIYGLVLLLLCLCCKVVRVEDIRETANLLIEIMQPMFIPAAVGLMVSWDVIRPHLAAYIVITVLSTFLVFLASGHVTQAVQQLKRKEGGKDGIS